jgi:hypothetical protein
MSQTLMVLSSPALTISSCFGWNKTLETLLKCPLQVSTSQALLSLILQSLICLSSPLDTIRGNVGWKDAKLTPRSCPSRTYLTVEKESKASKLPTEPGGPLEPIVLALEGDLRREEISQTRTVWSMEADTTRSSFGWKKADMM